MPEIYVSTDIESDGPIPGPNSMYSFGSHAFDENGLDHGSFYATLLELPGAKADPGTAEFWAKNKDAYAAARKDPRPPEAVMPQYRDWLKHLPGKPVFVGYPAAFDFSWIRYYLISFAQDCPFSHSCLDMKTFAWSLMKRDFRDSVKHNFPKKWLGSQRHNHNALDDAIEQGQIFLKMLEDRNENRKVRS